jgi:broad specificity phosphatase PhoE
LQKPGKTLVFSSHGNAIALFLNVLDPKVGFEEWKGLRNPDIIRVEWRDGEFGEWERVEWKEEHE